MSPRADRVTAAARSRKEPQGAATRTRSLYRAGEVPGPKLAVFFLENFANFWRTRSSFQQKNQDCCKRRITSLLWSSNRFSLSSAPGFKGPIYEKIARGELFEASRQNKQFENEQLTHLKIVKMACSPSGHKDTFFSKY